MDGDVEDFRAGGSIPQDLQELLQGCDTCKILVRRRVMGYVTLDWDDPGRFPPQVGLPYGKYADKKDRDRHVDLSATGSGNEGSGYGGYGDVSPLPP